MKKVVLCVALLASIAHASAAQNLYGSLVGNVTDSSGAAIPGATVTATQTETNLTREVITNESGAYSIPNIPSGTYQVVVAVPGFQNFTARNIVVTNRDVRVDARLSLGALEEAVTVTATAAILQTENAAVQHLATSEQLQTLPTSGRAFQSFMTLMPGVADPNYQQSGGINNPGRTMSLTINGQPATNTVVRLDGITATNQFFESIQSYGPSLEAIETVNVVTSSFDADQGMAGAAAVNVQVKTGTNNFRGSAFEYAVDARMRARNYFLPAGRDKGTSSVHVFGGTLGGPIIRNKLFFFFSDETTRQRTFNGNAVGQTGTSGFVSLPPTDLRRGDFSQTGTVIYDPLTGNPTTGAGRVPFAFANCPGVTSTTDSRFASCNYIPANRINPIAAAMLSQLVLPTQPGYTNNYFVTNAYDTTYHKIDGKITYNPNTRLNLNARLGFLPSWERSAGILPSVDGSPVNPLSQGRVWDSFVDSHSIGATSILSQSFVVDGSFGYTKHNVHVFPPVDTCYGDFFGIRNACQPPYSLDTNVPGMTGTGYTLNGESPIRDYVDPQWQFVANAGWTKGSHNVKFGVDYIILQQDHYETQAQSFAFNGGVTTIPGGVAANDFNRFASFLLGMPSARTAQVMTPLIGGDASGASHPSSGEPNEFRPNTLRNNNVGTYVRDQWNITPKITASVGVRWEYYSLPRRADHGIEVYNFDTNRLLICGIGPNEANCGIEVEKNLFTPRLGLAYRPMEDLVIRAGYSRNPQSNNPGRQQMVPSQSFPQTIVITENAPNNVTSVGSLSDGSTRVQPADQSSGVLVLPRGAGVNTYKDEYVRGKISSWNVSVQKALGQRMSATVAYVANRQNGMTRNRNVNYGTLGGGAASQPFNPLGITSAMNIFTPDGKIKYDSMQLSMNRRMSEGMQFTVAYTFAQTTDWWRRDIPIPEYWHLNKGLTGVPHRLNASLIYELPFGDGKTWMNNDGVLSNVVGGWQLNTFFSYASGTLVDVTSNANVLNAPGTTVQWADKVKDGPVEIFGDAGPQAQYFDVSAFRSVTEVRFGNSGHGVFRGPSAPNVDLSLFRVFRFGQTKTLQVRVEVFNISNTPHFSNPSTTISNVTFNPDGTIRALNGVGGITSTDRTGRQYDEREWRLGLRFGF
jgi:Carboxypeptidase regulatory-like domain/TonB dependent receptor-like, beta-barrel